MDIGRQRWEALTPDLVLRVTWTAAGSKLRNDFSLRGHVRRGIISVVVSTVLGSQVPLFLPSGNTCWWGRTYTGTSAALGDESQQSSTTQRHGSSRRN